MDPFAHFMGTLALKEPIRDLSNQRTLDASRRSVGSAAGLATTAWTAESNQTNAWFGSSVATVGDVNGDGFSDVIVGASNYCCLERWE